MVVLKELIFNSFYIGMLCGGLERTDFKQFLFGQMWWSWKNWFLTVSIFRRYGGLKRTDFEQFLYCKCVVVLKELILNSFYIRKVVVLKNWYGGLDRIDFKQFLYWEGVVILKELIFNSVSFGMLWWSWKNWF